MFSRKLTTAIAIGTAAVAAGIGAYAIAHASSGNGASDTAKAAPFAYSSQNNQRVVGQVPQGWHSGSGTIITGASADKAEAVAVANYPGGTVTVS